ncbi:MAG: TraR/DksA C4-type zinc finger protein [bacterium]|nr:TraR/DksA C4-type zinc finger protein [bacterium]
MITKQTLEELKNKLDQEKLGVESQLKKFAEKDKKLPGDWDTKYPKFNGAHLEEAADEVEAYGNLLSVEYSLEIRLKNIEEALEKIKKGNYGKCEKCGKEMDEERLKVSPEAKFCVKCKS